MEEAGWEEVAVVSRFSRIRTLVRPFVRKACTIAIVTLMAFGGCVEDDVVTLDVRCVRDCPNAPQWLCNCIASCACDPNYNSGGTHTGGSNHLDAGGFAGTSGTSAAAGSSAQGGSSGAGASSTAGTSGSGTGGTGGDPPLPDWLVSNEIWQPVPNGEPMGLYWAEPAKVPFVPRVWSDCGTGCQVAGIATIPTPNPVKNVAPSFGSHAGVYGGETYIRIEQAYANPIMRWWTFTRLSDGGLVGIVKATDIVSGGFVVGGTLSFGRATALLLPLGSSKKEYFSTYGNFFGKLTVAEGSKYWQWQSSWIETGILGSESPFSFEGGWGVALPNGSINLLSSPSQTQYSILDTLATPCYRTDAWGPWLVWYGLDIGIVKDVVRGYHANGGVRTLATSLEKVIVTGNAVSDKYVAWIYDYTYYQGQAPGGSQKFELHVAALPPDGVGDVVEKLSLTLPVDVTAGEMRTWGDLVVVQG